MMRIMHGVGRMNLRDIAIASRYFVARRKDWS
jgi:hypothetical protein